MTRRCFISAIYVLLAFSPAAQQARQFSFRHFSSADGLAANDVRGTIQDEQGFIWIATAEGLQRFDGTRFITFRHVAGNPTSLPANAVLQLMKDRQKNLWVLLENGSAGVFDTRKFTFREVPVLVSDPKHLRADKELYHDLNGNILYMLRGAEILEYDTSARAFRKAASIPTPRNWKIYVIAADTARRKYWMGGDSGIAVLDQASRKLSFYGHNEAGEPLIETYGSTPSVYHIFVDSRRRLWFESWPPMAGEAALFCYNLQTGRNVLHRFSFGLLLNRYHELRNLTELKNGEIWIRGQQVFARFNEEKKDFTLVYNGYVNEQSIYYDVVNHLSEDREQNLWISTNNNGLYLYNPYKQLFTVVKHLDRQRNVAGRGAVMSFTHTNRGTILAGTWGNGIYEYDSSFSNLPVQIKGIAEKNYYNAWSMYRSSGNTIWMSMQPGLLAYNQAANTTTFHDPAILEKKTVRQVVEDGLGNLWLGLQSRGLFKWDKSKAAAGFDSGFVKVSAIPPCSINQLVADSKGYIWVCTPIEGIYKIDPASNTIADHINASGPAGKKLLDNIANCAVEFNDSIMMIAAGGLNIYNTRRNTVTQLTAEDGLPSDIIMSMEKDLNNDLWLGMLNGLCHVNYAKKKISLYNRNDGFINDNFVLASSYRLPDGRLLFGTSEDFIVFDPVKIRSSSLPPDVQITDIKLLNKQLPVDSLLALRRIELPYDQNSVVIEFAGLTFQDKDKIAYYYMLEGLDKEWKKADKLNQATYNYLPPNTYVFKIKSETGDGMESRRITSFKLKIKPPFWKTWWFVSLLAFAGLSLFIYLDRLRVMRMRVTISMRNRIAANFTKDMSSTLGTINVLSEMAKVKAATDSERTKEYVSQISDNSNRMIEVMDDMIWSIKPENDGLEHTISRMMNYAAALHAKYDVEIHFELGEKVKETRLRMDQRQELYTIFKEALTNAAKHSHAKYIDVTVKCHKSKLRLRIQDEGRGFDVATMSFGRGINDMQKKASSLRAKFDISSEINTGTIVHLDMPVD